MPPELLQEERDAGPATLIPKVPEPREFSRAGATLALTPGDQPMYSLEIELWQSRKQWFG